ncbi:MAG: hypothetical protein KatS3mg044_0926 [Rhodothermaceae bacterium]|nr:MAG: hypothetical protein KatS3mg044_0926 [Rhodothermaceae bacterium]
MKRRTLVLVEPVCRGSRLHNLFYIVKALVEHANIVVLTRPDFKTDHFVELFGDYMDEVDVLKTSVDLGGKWFRELTISEFYQYCKTLKRIESSFQGNYDIFFLAIDDYMKGLLFFSMFPPFELRYERAFGIRYRVSSVLSNSDNLRHRFIRGATTLIQRKWNINLAVMDERMEGRFIGERTVSILPDPWEGEFSPFLREDAREKYGFDQSSVVALVLGRQVERKGFPFLLEVMEPVLKLNPSLKFWIVGKIDEIYKSKFDKMLCEFHGRIIHCDSFVPEKELPSVFAASDIVLLPYSTTFDASSGILPRAAASGVPVIASDHGLIGHRVKMWKMGEVFRYGDVESFVSAISDVVNGGREVYQDGLSHYAKSTNLKSFVTCIQDMILP